MWGLLCSECGGLLCGESECGGYHNTQCGGCFVVNVGGGNNALIHQTQLQKLYASLPTL